MVGINPAVFKQLADAVDDNLLRQHHHSLEKGTQIVRVANTFLSDRTSLLNVHTKSRGVWLGIIDPTSPHRFLDEDARAALETWQNVLSSASFCISMLQPSVLPVCATADAMTTKTFAGLGGLALFSNGKSAWFQFGIPLDEAQPILPWLGDDMQKHISTWELLPNLR